ncbi:MAG: trypsin-like peptidase domain-containing protein [Nitrospirae bacterium]|nr:trypsin-like peptidase domain-containing protein [Nitrospirota bacterium]
MTRPLSNQFHRLALGLTLWAMIGPAGMAQAAASPKDTEQENTVRAYKKVAPATVFITSANLGGNQTAGQTITGGTNAIGSGLLLDEQGLIVTNAHVVEGATKVFVTLYEGARLPAEIVGSDPITDLALLHVVLPPGRHATAALGNSDQIEVGQKVLAIGHPFGLGYALTTGVISGFGSTPETATLIQDRVIQTSAAINPGNSGGPLVDTEGRVIGINTALLAGAQNIGFAIPINAAKSVMAELRAQGRVIRPWLGITGRLLSDDIINLFALPMSKGLLVAGVATGSPAEKIGLRGGELNVAVNGDPWILGGDILVAVNGFEVKSPEQYVTVFKSLKVGQTIDLKIKRDGAYRLLTVTLEERPHPKMTPGQPRGPERVEFRPLSWRIDGGTTEPSNIETSF